jgi:hypothetical protein
MSPVQDAPTFLDMPRSSDPAEIGKLRTECSNVRLAESTPQSRAMLSTSRLGTNLAIVGHNDSGSPTNQGWLGKYLPWGRQSDVGTGRSPSPISMTAASAAQREAEWLSIQFCASADFTHSPATCLVVTLRRFQTLIVAMAMIRTARVRSS